MPTDGKHNGNGFVGYDPELDVVVVSFAGTDTRSMANWYVLKGDAFV